LSQFAAVEIFNSKQIASGLELYASLIGFNPRRLKVLRRG